MGKPPKKQEDFHIGAISEAQLGTIAIFGADEDIIHPIAYKLITVSSKPNIPVFSRMGEEAPMSASEEDIAAMAEMENQDVEFSLRERHHLDKIFMIFRLIGLAPDGQKAYAFVNVRGDRCENLLRRAYEGTTFNLSNYATYVLVGLGDITDEINEKLEKDYLFGTSITTVRIFPPLDQVT